MIRKTFKTPNSLMRLGMAFFLLAAFSKTLLRRSGWVSENATDLIMGLCYGLMFGTMILYVIARREARSRS